MAYFLRATPIVLLFIGRGGPMTSQEACLLLCQEGRFYMGC